MQHGPVIQIIKQASNPQEAKAELMAEGFAVSQMGILTEYLNCAAQRLSDGSWHMCRWLYRLSEMGLIILEPASIDWPE